MDRIAIARVAHEVNRAYCASLGDVSQPAWEDAPEWQKASALVGVDMHLAKPDATPEQSHESWLAQKLAEGWKYGPVKDAEKKEHPCCVPYAELPAEQKAKDYLFRGTVHALSSLIVEAPVSAPVALSPPPVSDGLVAVQYIGRRPKWNDHLYGTGLYFTADQVRNLPATTARQFLRHQDLFREGKVEVAPEPITETAAPVDDTAAILEQTGKQQDEQREDIAALQDLHDQVNIMDKEGLKEFAFTHFKQNLDKRLAAAELRAKVHQFIDQFGVAP